MKLDTSIEYLKGVGPRRAEVFKKELKINTFYDFLNFFPYRYLDKTKLYKIKDVKNTNSYIQFIGKITSVYQTQAKGKRIIAKIKNAQTLTLSAIVPETIDTVVAQNTI